MNSERTGVNVSALLAPALGLKVAKARLGIGSALLFDLDSADRWSALLTCDWRLETCAAMLAGSDDGLAALRETAAALTGRTLREVTVADGLPDVIFEFDDGLRLRTFATVRDDDAEHWLDFMPEGRVLVAGPGSALAVRASGTERGDD